MEPGFDYSVFRIMAAGSTNGRPEPRLLLDIPNLLPEYMSSALDSGSLNNLLRTSKTLRELAGRNLAKRLSINLDSNEERLERGT